jgi:peptidoglycan/LPS O-acetylase OafA/YrhL
MNATGPSFRLGHRPALDGLRGIAILLVLANHGGWLGDYAGFAGVNTFFVLSGFLITCLLVGEYDQTGRLSFRQFYLRRALRLLPALVAMLLLFVAFSGAMDPPKRALRELYEALVALFYFSNWAGIYHLGRHISLAHTWSLSVEEQFYILWPVLLLFLLGRNSRPSLLCWIGLGVFLSVLVRIGLFVGATTTVAGNVFPVASDRLLTGTDCRADSLLLGCLAGVLISSNLLPRRAWFERSLHGAALASAAGLAALGFGWFLSPFMVCAGWLLASIFVMVIILQLLSATRGPLHWVLENRGLVFTGRISYGLYVWHFPILKAMEQHHWPTQNMRYLALAVPAALLSYYLIERPFLRLKQRHQVVQ